MIELSRHIKALLLENDCVIIPGLGGFIAHNCPAIYEKVSNTFLAPARTIGFNPQLTLNDGVLVQSYMEAYNTDFPDATRKIEKTVEYIKSALYTDGQIELNDIGILYYNVNGSYQFEPFQNAFFSPALYGLDNFKFPQLQKNENQKRTVSNYDITPVTNIKHPQHHSYKNVANFVFRNAAAVAAAILLFFVLSVQVQNTYVDDANYASIGSIGIFHSIKDYSAATMNLSKGAEPQQSAAPSVAQPEPKREQQDVLVAQNHPKRQIKPVTVRTETVTAKKAETAAKAEKPDAKVESAKINAASKATPAPHTAKTIASQTDKRDTKGYYIIIASLANKPSAEKELIKFKAAGCTKALILESNGRFRIAYSRYDSKIQAQKDINMLKQNDNFKSAWIFAAK